MVTKTFRADTIIEALQQVQAELGPEALVISMRQAPPGPAWQVWRRSACEIIATTDTDKAPKSPEAKPVKASSAREEQLPEGVEWIDESLGKSAPAAPKVLRSQSPFPTEKKAAPVKEAMPWMPPRLHQFDEDLLMNPRYDTVSHFDAPAVEKPAQAAAPATEHLPLPLKKNLDLLASSGLDAGLIGHIQKNCLEATSPSILADEKRCRNIIKRQLEAFIRVVPPYAIESPVKRLCLVGPSGSGKTSCAARLAAFYMRKGLKVVWIHTDTLRAGAVAESRAYAEALNVPYHLAYLPEDIPVFLHQELGADVVLIDTPGFNPYSESQVADIGSILTAVPERSTYLLAPATLKESDLAQCMSAVGIFGLNAVIATKLDETGSLASIYNFTYQSRLPLAFFTKGKQVVDDFVPATCAELVNELFRKAENA